MIVVHSLVKYYGERCAIKGVSFDIEPGHVVGFLGLNGAGKTTILRMIAGDLEPSAGSISVAGKDLLEDPVGYRAGVGFLPERVPVYPDLTVHEYLQYCGGLRGMGAAECREQIPEVCDTVAMGSYVHAPIRHLSHGYTKRLGIASAIIHRPDLVILDEAISGLDPVQIVEMRSLVRSLAGRHTVLVSSHILTEISQTCDDILVIQDGEIAARGTEEDLRRRFGGGNAFEVTVRGAAAAATAAIEGVEGIEAVQPPTAEGDDVSLRISAHGDVRAEVVRALVGAGLDVVRLDLAEKELEAAFLELARKTRGSEEVSP